MRSILDIQCRDCNNFRTIMKRPRFVNILPEKYPLFTKTLNNDNLACLILKKVSLINYKKNEKNILCLLINHINVK